MSSLLLAIDIGTQGTKTGILEPDGTVLSQAFEESKLYHSESASSVHQEPEEIYQSVVNTVRQAVASGGIDPKRIASIGITGQMAGILGINDDFQHVTYFDSWLDTRCEPYIKRMKQEAGELIHRKSGAAPTYAHGPKILWWKENRPDDFAATKKWVVPTTYVAGRLAGLKAKDAFIDYTHLVFAAFVDVQALTWDAELLDIFQVPVEKLPRIVGPCDIIGELTPSAAEELGLVPGIPIAAGIGDQAAGALGAGIAEHGMVYDVAGTASVFAAGLDRYVPDMSTTFMIFRSALPERWVALAYINGGGLALPWFRDTFAGEDKQAAEAQGLRVYELLDKAAQDIAPGCDGLTFIPHLGGRVCPPMPDLRGVWHGFSWGHGRAHFYRSILEAIAYEYDYYKSVLEGLTQAPLTEVRVTGGGAKSQFWNQMKADILNLTYRQLKNNECALLGAAMVAGHGAGVYKDLREAIDQVVTPVGAINPDPARHEQYRPHSAKYRKLLEELAASLGM